MKIQGHLQDYPLPILLEVLADRRESGCLHIAFEPEPAILHFKRGQLMDARISLLRGAAAINLALSMKQAPFDFDNEIVLPHSAIDSQERAILTRLLGMRLSVEADAEPETYSVEEPETCSVEEPETCSVEEPETYSVEEPETYSVEEPETCSVEEPENESKAPETRVVEAPTMPRLHAISASITDQSKQGQRSIAEPQEPPEVRPVFSYFPRPQLLRITAVILIVGVPAAVGITVRLGRRMVPAPANAATGQPKIELDPTQAIPSSTGTAGRNSPAATTVEPAPVQPTHPISKQNSKDRVAPKDVDHTKIVGESEVPKVISEVTKMNGEAGSVPESANTSSSSPESRLGQKTKTIVVEVQIDQGRVTGAWVKNSRKGFEAFEAAALRIIRQRRYSKESTGTESVAVDVTVN